MQFQFYNDLNGLNDLEYYLSQPETARDIESDFFQVAEHLMIKNLDSAFSFLLQRFYPNIVEGDYRPSPAYYHIHDLFLLAAEQKNYEMFFDCLYDNGYNPVIHDLSKLKHGELISKLLEKQNYQQLNYLIEKHQLPKSISKEDKLNYFIYLSSSKKPDLLKKFLEYDIYIPLERFENLYHGLSNKNIENALQFLNILKSSSYSQDIKNVEVNKEELFLRILLQSSLNYDGLKKLLNYFEIQSIDTSVFKKIFKPFSYGEDTFITLFTDFNKLKILKELGIDNYYKNEDQNSTYLTFLNIISRSIHSTITLNSENKNKYIEYIPFTVASEMMEEISIKQRDTLFSNLLYKYRNDVHSDNFKIFIDFIFRDELDKDKINKFIFSNYNITYSFNDEYLETAQHVINTMIEKKTISESLKEHQSTPIPEKKKRL